MIHKVSYASLAMALPMGTVLATALALAAGGCKSRSFNSKDAAGVREMVNPSLDDSKKRDLTDDEIKRFLPRVVATDVPFKAVWEVFNGVEEESRHKHAKVYFGPLKESDCTKLKSAFVGSLQLKDPWLGGLDKDKLVTELGISGIQCDRVTSGLTDGEAKWNGYVATSDGKPLHFLLDHFLTPVMQATMRHSFVAESDELLRQATPEELRKAGAPPNAGVMTVEGVYLDTNCWATAYEVSRYATPDKAGEVDYDLHVIMPRDFFKTFRSPANAKDRGGAIVPSAFLKWHGQYGAAFGDVLVVASEETKKETDKQTGDEVEYPVQLLHAAVFVDNGLLFERVGNAQPNLPFRLVGLDDIMKEYGSDDYRFYVYTPLRALPQVKDNEDLDSVEFVEGTVYVADQKLEDVALTLKPDGTYKMGDNAYKRGVQKTQD
jgi:hypothetical protein